MRWHRNWLFGLGLLVATFLIYQPAWNGQPIWDDEIHITTPELRSWHGLARIWTDPGAAPQYYPFLGTIFWLEHKLWSDQTVPYHLLNILLHGVAALLLLKILRELEVKGAWLASALFALHPVQVESVAWICELKNTLSTVLGFASVIAYLNYDRQRIPRWYWIAISLFVFALMTKTVTAMLAPAVLIILWWKRDSLAWNRDLKPLVPFFVIGAAAGLITAWVEQKFAGASGPAFAFSIAQRCLIAGRAFWFYLAKLFWPADLITIYPRWHVDITSYWQWLFPAAALLLVLVLWMARRRFRGPFAATLIIVAMLFPTLGFLNVSYFQISFVADHFQYAACAPIFALAAAVIASWLEEMPHFRRLVGYALAGFLLTMLAGSSWAQSHIYRDNETCFRDVLSKNPASATAHNNLANVLRQKGALDEAIDHYRRALELEPNYQFGRYNLGATLVQKGDAASAIPLLQAALDTDPNNPKAYYSLGTALQQTGRSDEAVVSYDRALQLQPQFVDARTNLGNLLLERGDNAGAMAHYRKAVELDPNSPMTHYNLAVGLARTGRNDEAIAELRTVLRIQPTYPDAQPLLNDLQSGASPR